MLDWSLSLDADIGHEYAFFKKVLDQIIGALPSTRPAVRNGTRATTLQRYRRPNRVRAPQVFQRRRGKASTATRGSFKVRRPPSWRTSLNGLLPQSHTRWLHPSSSRRCQLRALARERTRVTRKRVTSRRRGAKKHVLITTL